MDLFALLLAALSGPITQASRLLRLHTPLGPDVLLAERAEIVESIGPYGCAINDAPVVEAVAFEAPLTDTPVIDIRQAPRAGYAIEITALCLDVHVELKSLIGQPVLLELLTQASRRVLRPFHGHVTRFELLGSDAGLARFRLIVEPFLAFAAYTQDSRVFQSMSVPAIVDAVLGNYLASGGRLAPAWRWELSDPSVYPERSYCGQYEESDLDFVLRLLAEEGIVYWFEHESALGEDALGTHTLVLADHEGAFKANPHPRVRYTQSSASMDEDSLVRWGRKRSTHTAAMRLATPDYRAAGEISVTDNSIDPAANTALELQDVPGQYTYETRAQGERLVRRRQEALDAQAHQVQAGGPYREAQVATTLTLLDHPIHDGADDTRDRFVTLGARLIARNNLSADIQAQLQARLGADDQAPSRKPDDGWDDAWGNLTDERSLLDPQARRNARAKAAKLDAQHTRKLANDSAEPLFSATLELQPAALAVRSLPPHNVHGLPDARLSARPTVHGVQTALVVGTGAPIYSDRDHRIKIQLHWQRGSAGSHRSLTSSGGSGAPANDASSTWARVGEAIAGANWGSNFAPRVGQEVLVAFTGADIDRPVVVGSLYNGRGQPDAQHNAVAGGAAGATGDAPAWFPGSKAAGAHEGHRHAHVLSGFKTQALGTSSTGTGGYNQLVFDDSASGGRIELSTTQANTRLQLGRLVHQSDNQRLNARGFGIDLTTTAWGAMRAGSGILVSAWHRPGDLQMDARAAQALLQGAAQLTHTLSDSAQDHLAMLQGEPIVKGAKPGEVGKQLDVQLAQHEQQQSLAATDAKGDPGDGTAGTISGGMGTVPAWSRPELLLTAPAGIGAYTPAHHLWSAGTHIALSAGQDSHQIAQRHASLVAKDGIVLYTYGRAGNPHKPNQETGIKLHAASGNVNVQSQSAATTISADKNVEVSSTHGAVKITAPHHVLLAAAGAAVRIDKGSIKLLGPGTVEFRASMKVLTSMGAASRALELKAPAMLADCPTETLYIVSRGGSAI